MVGPAGPPAPSNFSDLPKSGTNADAKDFQDFPERIVPPFSNDLEIGTAAPVGAGSGGKENVLESGTSSIYREARWSATARHISSDERIAALQSELIMWAGLYASQGFPVFPVRGDKRPLVKWKAGATVDPSQFVEWWGRWPVAMIGVPTGKPSGIVVLDVDVKNGVNGFETLKCHGWVIPADAIEIKTPSGGSHFYFSLSETNDLRNSAGKLGPGLDVRGTGGYIVVPPSRPTLIGPDYGYAEGQSCEAGRLLK